MKNIRCNFEPYILMVNMSVHVKKLGILIRSWMINETKHGISKFRSNTKKIARWFLAYQFKLMHYCIHNDYQAPLSWQISKTTKLIHRKMSIFVWGLYNLHYHITPVETISTQIISKIICHRFLMIKVLEWFLMPH